MMHGDVTGSARRDPSCVLAADTGKVGWLQIGRPNAQVSKPFLQGRQADVPANDRHGSQANHTIS